MNRWMGMGRITRDLELKYSKDNMAILKFSIAVNRIKKGETDFINCLAFKEKAENIAKFFKKGKMIAIEGRIQTGSYDNKEGQKVYTTEVLIDGFHFTGEKKDEDVGQPPAAGFENADNLEDELPF